MSIYNIQLSNRIDHLGLNVAHRGRVLAYAVGYYAARKALMPSSAVANPNLFYVQNVEGAVADIVSQLNEAVVFDTIPAMDYARRFWQLRYQELHDDEILALTSCRYDFFCTISGVEKLFAQDEFEYLAEHKQSVVNVYNLIRAAFKETSNNA